MAVRQVSKKDATKDGRHWYFYTYIRDITGNKKRYKSKKYHTQKEAEKAEVKEIRIHDFRHSCASLLVNNGANIMIVAKYLGHTKIEETLNTYTHLFNSTLNEVVDLIDKLE